MNIKKLGGRGGNFPIPLVERYFREEEGEEGEGCLNRTLHFALHVYSRKAQRVETRTVHMRSLGRASPSFQFTFSRRPAPDS